jgi:hypothetical protein
VGFDNGFESMIGKLPFLDLDSSRNSGIMFFVEPEGLEFTLDSENYLAWIPYD